MKGLTKNHICITHGHRHQYGDSQREEGWGLGRDRQRVRENGDIRNSVNNKNKRK